MASCGWEGEPYSGRGGASDDERAVRDDEEDVELVVSSVWEHTVRAVRAVSWRLCRGSLSLA